MGVVRHIESPFGCCNYTAFIAMRSKPSSTARFVALGRAIADLGLSHIPGFSDPTARIFLSDKGKSSLAKIEAALQEGKKSSRVEMSRVMADMIGLRTA